MKQFIRLVMVKLAKQRSMSPLIGALLSTYSSTAILYAPLTLIGVATTVYGLWGADLIKAWFPWFTVWHLLGCMVLFILIMMVFFYKVVIPSSYTFQVQQQYKHGNPIVDDIQGVIKKQKEIDGRLRKIERMLLGLIERQKNSDG